jgi:hypothetical protein
MQGLDSLSSDLFIWYFWSLGLQLQEPLVEIGEHFFFSLRTGHKIFFHIELRLETLEVEQELFFELLPWVNASQRESGIPICCSILERDDEWFGEGSFVPSGWGCGDFVAHKELAGIRVSMVYWRVCGLVMGRPWCELQVASEQALGVDVAESRWRWGRQLEELVVWRWWWLVVKDVVKLWRWWGDMSVWWECVDVVLMLPLNQRWLLSLLLLAKDVNGIL